jgi:phosphatidylserine/phosphatidylglycerophosphate/cardiolipin synthase-like enzyme
MPIRPKYAFPWRKGNHFELLIDGREFFPRMLEAIELARRRVWLEIYLFESGAVADRFIDALARAARRGLDVRVLVDDFGVARLNAVDRQRLTAAGVVLRYYNPLHMRKWLGNFFRDHRKLLITDSSAAFVSGTGITDEFEDRATPDLSWRETAVRITGPVLADWETLFRQVWREHLGETLPSAGTAPAGKADGMSGRVATSASLRQQDIRRSLYRHVRAADQRIWIATAYFVPSRKLLRGLKGAAQRGVDVRLLLPGPFTDHPAVRHAGRRFYTGLLKYGVRVFEYQPRFLHAKTMLCDQWVTIGSSNFDRWNLRWNLEANQEVGDARFAAGVQQMFERDFLECIEIRLDDWRRRSLRQRLREHLWGRVDMFLESLGRVPGTRLKSSR